MGIGQYECDVCHATTSKPYMCAPDFRLGIGIIYSLVKCCNCGLVFLSPQPTSEVLFRSYPDWLWEVELWDDNKLVKRTQDFLDLLTRVHQTPGTLLDVGCGTGDFLLAARSRGWQAEGIEVNERVVQAVRSRGARAEVVRDFPEYTPPHLYDALTFHHVLEHVPSPRTYLSHARDIIKPNGLVLISVPNICSFDARFFGPFWWHLDLPRHLFHFSPDTLAELVESVGFTIEEVNYHSLEHNASGLRRSVQRLLRNRRLKITCENDIAIPAVTKPQYSHRYGGKKLASLGVEMLSKAIASITEVLKVADVVNIVARS